MNNEEVEVVRLSEENERLLVENKNLVEEISRLRLDSESLDRVRIAEALRRLVKLEEGLLQYRSELGRIIQSYERAIARASDDPKLVSDLEQKLSVYRYTLVKLATCVHESLSSKPPDRRAGEGR